MDKGSGIYVAGHRGLVGSAIMRRLVTDGYTNLTTRTHAELDLTDQKQVRSFFDSEKPQYVFLAAAKVGGILANDTYPGDFIRQNLLIQTNVIDAAYRSGVKKLLFLGSSCVYPKYASQPITEDQLLTAPLEPTNLAYAVAKIAGVTMAQAYRRQYGFLSVCLMPTNLYGPGDNFDLANCHVMPALIRKFHEAKVSASDKVTVWGSGKPKREFLYIDDLADAALFMMLRYDEENIINIGTGKDISIADLAELICSVVKYEGQIVYDRTKPDGTPRKVLDVSRATELGWRSQVDLEDGIVRTYDCFVQQPSASEGYKPAFRPV